MKLASDWWNLNSDVALQSYRACEWYRVLANNKKTRLNSSAVASFRSIHAGNHHRGWTSYSLTVQNWTQKTSYSLNRILIIIELSFIYCTITLHFFFFYNFYNVYICWYSMMIIKAKNIDPVSFCFPVQSFFIKTVPYSGLALPPVRVLQASVCTLPSSHGFCLCLRWFFFCTSFWIMITAFVFWLDVSSLF